VSVQDDYQTESAPDEEERQHLREQLRAHRSRLHGRAQGPLVLGSLFDLDRVR